MAEECSCMQLIDGNGNFNASRFENFGPVGISYVVSIMGPRSGGKSSLLNHLFGTNFDVMDASYGRNQTTKGIWVAKSGNEPCTLVMDLEGTDGRERGENDTIFEKWSALFALAISDIVLINMWCHDIGRENAASRPLLRTVFKAILGIWRTTPRKVTLMFVLRDKTTTPLNILREHILEDVEEIWNSTGSRRGLEDVFDVKVKALSHYEYEKDQFEEQVAELRNEILGGHQRNGVLASTFLSEAKKIWKAVKNSKDLSIPSMKETFFNWNEKKKATVILSVAAAFSITGIAVGLAIPGLEGVALGMIPVVSGVIGELFALHGGRRN